MRGRVEHRRHIAQNPVGVRDRFRVVRFLVFDDRDPTGQCQVISEVSSPTQEFRLGHHVGGIDERSLVAWSRFGGNIRMSATAEFVDYDLFPGAIDWDTARYRTGLRPMTPDGPPLIGLGRHDNLYYNTATGMSAGRWRAARPASSPI
jgi:hypothetical protein